MKSLLYLFFTGLVFLTGCTRPEALGPGATFPALSVENLSGETVAVPAQFSAEMRLISIRTLGCRFCKSDFAEMEKLYQYYDRDKLAIFVINVGFEKKNVADFLRDKTVSFPVLVDKAMESMKLTKTTILPVVYLIDSRDVIIARIQGSFSFEEIRYEIDSFAEKSLREKNSL
nr:TlpA family protein disulfide reductase [Desulfobulbaceae bacterium]